MFRNLYEDDKTERTDKIRQEEYRDKKDFVKQSANKNMSIPLEYFYGIVSKAENESDLMKYYRNIKNNREDLDVSENIYLRSNENLDILFSKINVKKKKVLTVGSSGDQAIYSLYNGAKEVDLIDANILTKVFVELKIAAVKTLDEISYHNFMNRLIDKNTAKYYRKFSYLLTKDVQIFWDQIFLNADKQIIEKFSDLFVRSNTLNDSELYEGEEYLKLQSFFNLNDYRLNYIFADFKDFPKKANGKYDLILLSNVKTYIETTKDFFKTTKELYDKNLNENGLIQIDTSVNKIFKLDDYVKKFKAKKYVVRNAGIFGFTDSTFIRKPKTKEMIK